MTLITTQLRTFPLIHFKYAHVNTILDSFPFPRTVYPGETFQVLVVAVGQRDGTFPSAVISTMDQRFYPSHLPDSQHFQQANNMCTKLNYTLCFL